MGEHDETCPGCGKVHDTGDVDEGKFIEMHIEGLTEALRGLVVESNVNPRMATAIAIGTAMQLAVQMRGKDDTQDEALRELAKDVERMCVRHIESIEANEEWRTAVAEDHEVRKARMEQIERMLEQTGPLTELLVRNAQGSA